MRLNLEGRVIALTSLHLACCAVEASAAHRLLAGLGEPADEGREPDLHVLVVAGTVTTALQPRIRQAWESLPEPRLAVAFGVCTISGGPYWDAYSVIPGLDLEPCVMVPGCPPRPEALVAALRGLASTPEGVPSHG